ncbi:MAG: UDP-N-acetylmuramoyl-tripeptide--D-alanyl-D-alanine ligase [Bacteroidales bacterium]|nr:UDP-N-acetylmuramoyl-tripeptide--D-alanyl-D-alanine ligase [Bacteroidales bacterium]
MISQETLSHLYATYVKTGKVTTDSRKITPGCLFFAFKGANYDGNAFALQALQQGAALCVVTDKKLQGNNGCVVVDDVTEALQQLAIMHRQHLQIPVIGITGTNGKTTTKELIHAVLARRYRVSATKGNLNNHIGVPLTLLEISPNTELAIVEMGANHPGEIAHLCTIANPTHGLITNIGKAHLEGFGSEDTIIQTKTALYRHVAANKGHIFVNADNKLLYQQALSITNNDHIITYGQQPNVRFRGTHTTDNPFMSFYFEVGDNLFTTNSNLLGGYNFDNAMAAVSIGLYFHVEPFDIKEAIEEYTPSNQRSQLKRTLHNCLYLDCYNANPSSMAAAVASFQSMEGKHKMAIIGSMKELGVNSRHEHQILYDTLQSCHFDRLILVGPEFKDVCMTDGAMLFEDTAQVEEYLRQNRPSDSLILIKGSNSNHLWTLADVL